jgi:hypothetical protein
MLGNSERDQRPEPLLGAPRRRGVFLHGPRRRASDSPAFRGPPAISARLRRDPRSRPRDGRNPVAPGPTFNLAEALDDESLTQCVAQRDLPQPDHWMRSPLGGGDGKLSVLSGQSLAQSDDQVSRQKRTVAGSAQNPSRVGSVSRSPIEPGQDSGERAWIILHPISDDRQAEGCKARGIAIGAEKQAFALRREPCDDAGQNRLAANFAQRLIAAAHSPRQTARKHQTWRVGSLNHRRRLRAVSSG